MNIFLKKTKGKTILKMDYGLIIMPDLQTLDFNQQFFSGPNFSLTSLTGF